MTITPEKALEIYKMKKQGHSNLVIMRAFKINYTKLVRAINYCEKKLNEVSTLNNIAKQGFTDEELYEIMSAELELLENGE